LISTSRFICPSLSIFISIFVFILLILFNLYFFIVIAE